MLLAAGEGRRLGPLTEDRPKPMLPVGGRTPLEHNVRLLARHGFQHIAINLHHRPEVIRDYFGDGSKFGVEIRYSEEPQLLGTAGGVKKLESFFRDDTFLVVYSDNVSDCRLDRLIELHRRTAAVCTLAVFEREDVSSSGIVDMDEDGRVRRFLEKPAPDQVFSHWVNAGILAFEPAALDFVPAQGASDFSRDTLPALIAAGRPVYAYRMTTERLLWIDRPEDYQRSQRQLENVRFGEG
jgi:NDP-sugar pyrophosphorylase family protein